MRSLTTILITASSAGLLLLGACNRDQTTTTPNPTPGASGAPTQTQTATTTSHGGKGGQVVETGDYHLELLALKEAAGTHLDFYLQKGDSHEPIANAKVTGQVQSPDGTQQTVDFKYSADDQHYTAILPSTAPGEYKLAVLSDMNGEKVNGRFTFQQ